MEDLYSTLRCSEQASTEELKKSYLDLALKYHPDKAPEKHDSTAEFVKINKAWKILGDSQLKKQYDTLREERSLAQSHPVQETVDFDEFDETDVPYETGTAAESQCACRCDTGINGVVGTESTSKLAEHTPSLFTYTTQHTAAGDSLNGVNGDLIQMKSNSSSEEVSKGGNNVPNTKVNEESCSACINCGDEDVMTVFSYPCRCGGSYTLTSLEAGVKFDYVCCDGCSLTVHVIYDE